MITSRRAGVTEPVSHHQDLMELNVGRKAGTNFLLLANEAERLCALRKYKLLDTPPEKAYDDIVQLAAHICAAPIALISLVDEGRQWFKAKLGLPLNEAPLSAGFCKHAIVSGEEVFIVRDAWSDERFAGNPWVTSEPYARFYAGAPLVTRDGHVLGMLCVIDQIPRQLSQEQINALLALSRQAITQVEVTYQVAALQESELRFKTFMDNSAVLASIKDENGRYLYVNYPFLRHGRLSLSDVIGKTDMDLWPQDIAQRIREHDSKVLAAGEPSSEVEMILLQGGQGSYWQFSRFILEGQRRLLGSMGVDVTQAKLYEQQLMESQQTLRRSLERLEILSVTDGLTGLYNRRAFEEKLKEEFERARRYNLPLSLLMLDADRFKEFNDTLGHPAGDHLLQEIARILKRNARANDIAARYGGDEFAVILPNTDSRVAFHLAERLRRAAKLLWRQHHHMTISIGVSALTPDMAEPCNLIVAADNALYDAKRGGRNKVSGTMCC